MLQKTFAALMPKDQQVARRDIHQPVTREWRGGRCHGCPGNALVNAQDGHQKHQKLGMEYPLVNVYVTMQRSTMFHG